MDKPTAHPRRTLAILVFIFCIPMLTAWFLYKKHDTLGQTTQNGVLINPPFSISRLGLPNTHKQWRILYFYPDTCPESCQKGLYNIRQIRLATGKNRNRIERIFLTYPDVKNKEQLAHLLRHKFAGTHHYTLNPRQFKKQIQTHVKAPYAIKPGVIYLVDPNGNVMMSYPPNTEPMALFKDLQRLLKVSKIG